LPRSLQDDADAEHNDDVADDGQHEDEKRSAPPRSRYKAAAVELGSVYEAEGEQGGNNADDSFAGGDESDVHDEEEQEDSPPDDDNKDPLLVPFFTVANLHRK